jgi:hypothetical protein
LFLLRVRVNDFVPLLTKGFTLNPCIKSIFVDAGIADDIVDGNTRVTDDALLDSTDSTIAL